MSKSCIPVLLKTPQPEIQSKEKSEDTNYEDQCLTVGESDGASEFEDGSQNDQCEEESSSSYNNSPKR